MQLEEQTNQLRSLLEQGIHFLEQKKYFQSLLCFNRAVLLKPENMDALVHCATLLTYLNRPAEAIVYSERALQLKPNRTLLAMHAQSLYQLGNYIEALHCFERILAEDPNNPTVIGQRALCLTQVNRYDEALQSYQEALIQSQHQDPWIRYNYSLCLLAMGNLIPGFILFESRWNTILHGTPQMWQVPSSASIELMQGKSILIHSEQGLGDSIQFFRYIPLLVQLGARVVLEIQPTLIPLFATWSATITMIAKGAPLPACDYHCPMMSLARLFQTELKTIPRSIPYVFPDIHLLKACQKKLPASGRLRIGIVWKGSTVNAINHKRSMALSTLLTVYQPNMDFICLQQEVFPEEKKELDHHHIAYHSFELSTMVGTAALIACLDLVITVDTSMAHLAAAQGKKVWILLPLGADWRWFLEGEKSPWYPNVTLFRQETLGDWTTPLNRIKNALMGLKPIESPNRIEDTLQQAHQQFNHGFFFKAEQLYRTILINSPECHNAAEGVALAALSQNNGSDAILFMQRAVELAPQLPLYRRNLGELLRRAQQLEAALASHQQVIQLEPHVAENHYQLGLAYNDNHQFDLAIQHYRRALSYDQHHGLSWNNLGASLGRLGDQVQAKSAYLNAIQINPNHAEAQNNLGAIYSEEGKLDEARVHFEAAIAANLNFIEAHYNLSLIKTYSLDDPHLAYLEAIQEQILTHSAHVRIRYFFALGKALDDTQQYARAFQAYAEGNRLYSLQNPWDKQIVQRRVAEISQVFTPSFLKPPAPTQEMRCPIFIVGMPRSGTTLIEQVLSSHEKIYGAGELTILGEIIQEACHSAQMPFYEWVCQVEEDELVTLGAKYLERAWRLAPDKMFIVDKMPGNFFYIGLIYRMLPTAKIIHAIRDPMDSCFSCFTHLFKDNMLFAYDLADLGDYYRLYAQMMQHWSSVLPPTVIFDAPYEHMVANHEAFSKRLIEYLGLPWDLNCLHFYKNDRVVKTASITQVRKPIYKTSVQRWQHFSHELAPLLQKVSKYRSQQGGLS